MADQLEVKLTIKRDRRVVAIINDAEMAATLLSETHPEIAKLFVSLESINAAAQEQAQ